MPKLIVNQLFMALPSFPVLLDRININKNALRAIIINEKILKSNDRVRFLFLEFLGGFLVDVFLILF